MMKYQNNDDRVDVSKINEKFTRRKTVKAIGGGITVLPAFQIFSGKWETPILKSVFLTAHAQTSDLKVPVDPSVPVTPGHPDHPDYPLAPSHPDHPHNNPMAVIGSFTTEALFPPSAKISVEITINRIASYTFTLLNLRTGSSKTVFFPVQNSIPVTLNVDFFLEGDVGDTVELTVTNNLTSEVDVAQYVIEFTITIGIRTVGGCNSSFTVGLSTNPRTFTVGLFPNPGAGQSVTLEEITDGSPVLTFSKTTDANGEIIQEVSIDSTHIGSTRGLRAAYQGDTAVCAVRVLAL